MQVVCTFVGAVDLIIASFLPIALSAIVSPGISRCCFARKEGVTAGNFKVTMEHA